MGREPAGMEARGYRVTGRVQGVGFRWWTQRMARELGLLGSVRNLPDGSVEVQARGPVTALGRLEQALRDGPVSARVDRVDAIEAAGGSEPTDFRIGGW